MKLKWHCPGVLCFILVFLSAAALPWTAAAQTLGDAEQALVSAEEDVRQMADSGLPIQRASDLLEDAKNLFEAQKSLETLGGEADYSFVTSRAEEISSLKKAAFLAKDELDALLGAMQKLEKNEFDAVNPLYLEASEDFLAGRFEEAVAKIDEAYSKISELQSAVTKFSTLLGGWRASIFEFLSLNWPYIAAAAAVLTAVFAAFGKRVSAYRTARKIEKMEAEKATIRDLTKEAQEKYFGGEMPETTYYVKIGKYAEMTREINRQATVLKSRLKRKELEEKMHRAAPEKTDNPAPPEKPSQHSKPKALSEPSPVYKKQASGKKISQADIKMADLYMEAPAHRTHTGDKNAAGRGFIGFLRAKSRRRKVPRVSKRLR